MSLSLNEALFALFIQHLKNSETEPLCIKKAALVIGLQECVGTIAYYFNVLYYGLKCKFDGQ